MEAISPDGPARLLLRGRNLINFSSNDYLGLARHPRMIQAAKFAAEKWGVGATASRLICGTLEIHACLESRLADFKREEACLIFPSGYMANLGAIPALVGVGDAVILDRLCHASLVDGARLSRARLFVYSHLDCDALEIVLHRAKRFRKRLVITESLFSMDGDIAPLSDILSVCRRHGAMLYLDDAHGTGIFGKSGRGATEQFGLEGKADVVMGTLSKALGSQGGFVCGEKKFIQYLVNKSRAFIYTTGLSPISAACALEALKIIEENPGEGKKLLQRSQSFRESLGKLGFNVGNSTSQIIPVILGDVNKTIEMRDKLREAGFFVPAIRPPTVPRGKSRLRISLTKSHKDSDLNLLLGALA